MNKNLSIDYYRTIFGIDKTTFEEAERIKAEYERKHTYGGRKDGVTQRQRLEITLKYVRKYLSQRYLSLEYNTAKSCISPIIK